MTLSDRDKHLDQHHKEARIQWGCINCGRSFSKHHGAQCHISKYSGTSRSKEGAYKCETYPMSFGTERGLSTHERHAHLAVRNIKRRGTDRQSRKKWSLEKVALLKELEEIYKEI